MPDSQGAEQRLEFLPEVQADASELDEELRRAIATIVVELAGNHHLGELVGERPPEVLSGCRKIRFDRPGWQRKPRYRLVYRNEPSDGAVAVSCVLAIGRRDRMIAYAKAASRLTRRVADEACRIERASGRAGGAQAEVVGGGR
ncbi:MAG: type II toxin-antitoxin system RelE/ParE family toxin [Actinobacteria bacterium]|nr:type II toxin-antitoxin system RelE/ParE family toxin [Actinomycetota bacterium]